MGVQERLRTAQQANLTEFGTVTRVIKGIFAYTLLTELVGALVLMVRFVPLEGWDRGIHLALFHAVSAFNNAGFGLYPDNMIRFAEDPLVLLTTSTLVILGGLGYLALLGVALYLRDPRRNRLSLNTIIILVTSASLIVLGTVVVTVLEWNNPGTLGPLSTGGKLLSGYYQGSPPHRGLQFRGLRGDARRDAVHHNAADVRRGQPGVHCRRH
ncbi:potassium transporter TrkG [Deinococcus malanensis]|uniref:potassium transporter TrkG n=1 Tax=Deinococcus malanensis TaxID=1706855 RepID=UPI00363C1E36